MNNRNSEKTRVINQSSDRHNNEKETKILIVEEYPALCRQLVKLINSQSNLTVEGWESCQSCGKTETTQEQFSSGWGLYV